MSWPITVANFRLIFPNKICFENFSASIHYGERIALLGRNGSGKSSLLKMLSESIRDVNLAHIPQTITSFENLSGGERFDKALSQALGAKPDLLLLDEPTNHLDARRRQNLLRLLKSFPGALIVATHDEEFLGKIPNLLWVIKDGRVHIFRGSYAEYEREEKLARQNLMTLSASLKREKAALHQSLMKEQTRAAGKRATGERKIAQGRWTKMAGRDKKSRAEKSQGGARAALGRKREEVAAHLSELRPPEIVRPRFQLTGREGAHTVLVSIRDGSVAYPGRMVLRGLNLDVGSGKRLAFSGPNGSGKTSLLLAIMGGPAIVRGGQWRVPPPEDIGYLDQHYGNLPPHCSALDIMAGARGEWSGPEIRRHLADFLFRTNEEVGTEVRHLSGGERARLSLAGIAAKPPKLLLLDEITNNIDRETRNQVLDILRGYPAAMICVSHDDDFLAEIGAEKWDVTEFSA